MDTLDEGVGIPGQISASLHLLRVSASRLLRSRQSWISLVLLGFASVAVMAWTMRRERLPAEYIEDVFLTIYVAVLLPVFCLCYGSAGIASDREERTLVYLLISPLPRPLIFLAKAAASLLLALLWTLGSFALISYLAGKPGELVRPAMWTSVLWSTIAYAALFLLFSVLFQRATVVSLAYTVFLETLVGTLPGIAKRLTVSFYTRCMIFDAAEPFEFQLDGPFRPDLFLPISGESARLVLASFSGIVLLVSLLIFTWREYAAGE